MDHTVEEAAISLENVSKSFPGFGLGPVSLEVEPGYAVAVVGPNGSGKTTLFKLLMGLARPESGEVRLFGGGYPEDEVDLKRKIGYVPERDSGHDDLSARELSGLLSPLYPYWDQGLFDDLLASFELRPDAKFSRLSKGNQRRLSFALAVARRPELLLLDEPTDGIDPFARRTVVDRISDHLEGGGTVLFATHVMEEVRRLADYVALLYRGEFLGVYEKDALLESWRTLWVEREPDPGTPGVVEVEGVSPARLVTNSPKETEAALQRSGIGVIRSGAPELEEILRSMMVDKEARKSRVPRT